MALYWLGHTRNLESLVDISLSKDEDVKTPDEALADIGAHIIECATIEVVQQEVAGAAAVAEY